MPNAIFGYGVGNYDIFFRDITLISSAMNHQEQKLMKSIEHLPLLGKRDEPGWKRFVTDTILAAIGALAITGIIYTLQLYPRIPNISLLYLLVVLGLASTRGRDAAIMTSIVAFVSFDFFLVPPLYTFTISSSTSGWHWRLSL
jgi:K+-sensing histidine kinase KdpD